MSDAPVKRRRFRFGLRTLLALVTLAAVASWGYSVGWPWWQEYRERMQLEADISQIHVGDSPGDARRITTQWEPRQSIEGWTPGHKKDTTIAWMAYFWPSATYMLIFELKDGVSTETGIPPLPKICWESLNYEVYRLPPVPAEYPARTKNGYVGSPLGTWTKEQLSYLNDYIELFSGDRKNNYGLQYELIYSDPPAKPSVAHNAQD